MSDDAGSISSGMSHRAPSESGMVSESWVVRETEGKKYYRGTVMSQSVDNEDIVIYDEGENSGKRRYSDMINERIVQEDIVIYDEGKNRKRRYSNL